MNEGNAYGPVVLGIETSCDETAAAVVDASGRVLSNVVASQPELHEKYGGVVPEIASRRHLEVLVPVLAESLERAGVSGRDLDAIAVTVGPGLVGALLVGISAAKALGLAWDKPVLGINHLVGHVYANFLEGREDLRKGRQLLPPYREKGNQAIGETHRDDSPLPPREGYSTDVLEGFPGGVGPSPPRVRGPADPTYGAHTGERRLFLPRAGDAGGEVLEGVPRGDEPSSPFHEDAKCFHEGGRYQSPGAAESSVSVGEEVRFPAVCLIASGGHTDLVLLTGHGCFEVLGRTRDDAAGEVLDKIARAAGLGYPGGPQVERAAAGGDPRSVSFPRAFLEPGSFDFSFSGLKTAVLVHLKSLKPDTAADLSNLMASFQEAVMDVLAHKTVAAVKATRARCALLAGGVAANSRLRALLGSISPVAVFAPPLKFCTDNAAMIARAAAERLRVAGPDPNWPYLDGVPDLEIRSWI